VSDVRLSGYALHAGVITSLTLARHDGPITFVRGAHRADLSSLRVARTDFGVSLTDDHGFEVDLVEHFLAAIGGLGIGDRVLATIEGPELPILDGGARAFIDALTRLEIPQAPRRWVVEKPGRLEWRESTYELDVMDGVDIVVETEFAHPAMVRQRASWNGDPRRFAEEIAPARTFGFAEDAEDLWTRGRAGLAALASKGNAAATKAFADAVLVLDERGVVSDQGAASSPRPDELARHKLLDLVGDLTLYGGPPKGRIRALRPGHTATHRIIGEAMSLGILSLR
jgi:UDP-3-O-[3-hydroxymyristoyl] N-acetylglucosamine deacetylase